MAVQVSLLDLLSRTVDSTPEKLALRAAPAVGSGPFEDWSHRRLFDAGESSAARLAEAGVGHGDRVAVFLGNRPALVAAYLGLLRLGAAMVPVNLAYREREIAYILEEAEPRLVLTSAEHLPLFESLGADVLTPEDLSTPEGPAPLRPGVRPGVRPGAWAGGAGVGGDTPALLLFTSGTTGKSKAAVLTHDNVAATVRSLLEAWRWSADDRLLLTLPLFHTHGLVVGLHCALAAGATDNGGPGYRDYWPGYYAAFVYDPDGHNIEAVWYDYEKVGSA